MLGAALVASTIGLCVIGNTSWRAAPTRPPDEHHHWRVALDPAEPPNRRRYSAVKLRRIEAVRSARIAEQLLEVGPELRLALEALVRARR